MRLILRPSQKRALADRNAHVHACAVFAVVKVLAGAAGHPAQREREERQVHGAFNGNFLFSQWTFAENGESIAPLCGHSKHLDEGVGNFARER